MLAVEGSLPFFTLPKLPTNLSDPRNTQLNDLVKDLKSGSVRIISSYTETDQRSNEHFIRNLARGLCIKRYDWHGHCISEGTCERYNFSKANNNGSKSNGQYILLELRSTGNNSTTPSKETLLIAWNDSGSLNVVNYNNTPNAHKPSLRYDSNFDSNVIGPIREVLSIFSNKEIHTPAA